MRFRDFIVLYNLGLYFLFSKRKVDEEFYDIRQEKSHKTESRVLGFTVTVTVNLV